MPEILLIFLWNSFSRNKLREVLEHRVVIVKYGETINLLLNIRVLLLDYRVT